MTDINVNTGIRGILVKMTLALDAVRYDATVLEHDSRIANHPVPTPAALVPCSQPGIGGRLPQLSRKSRDHLAEYHRYVFDSVLRMRVQIGIRKVLISGNFLAAVAVA